VATLERLSVCVMVPCFGSGNGGLGGGVIDEHLHGTVLHFGFSGANSAGHDSCTGKHRGVGAEIAASPCNGEVRTGSTKKFGGSHRFVSDASVDADAAMRKAYAASNSEPIVRSNSVSRAVLPEARRLVIWPLRRLPSRADSEYPLI